MISVTLLVTGKTCAQNQTTISQYMFNSFLLNPAAAGSEGFTTINMTVRKQWVGETGSPSSYLFTAQTRIYKRKFMKGNTEAKKQYVNSVKSGKVGLGFHILNENIGIFNHNKMRLAYAYHISQGKSQISCGLDISLLQYGVNRNKTVVEDDNDKLINESSLQSITSNFNTGIYYSNPKIYAGLSLLNMLKSATSIGPFDGKYYNQRHVNMIFGYTSTLNSEFVMEPSVYFRMSDIADYQMDATVKLTYDQQLWMGTTYRTNQFMVFFGGFKINRLFLGYAYDHNLIPVRMKTFNTHEFMVSLKLGDNVKRYRWLERY